MQNSQPFCSSPRLDIIDAGYYLLPDLNRNNLPISPHHVVLEFVLCQFFSKITDFGSRQGAKNVLVNVVHPREWMVLRGFAQWFLLPVRSSMEGQERTRLSDATMHVAMQIGFEDRKLKDAENDLHLVYICPKSIRICVSVETPISWRRVSDDHLPWKLGCKTASVHEIRFPSGKAGKDSQRQPTGSLLWIRRKALI